MLTATDVTAGKSNRRVKIVARKPEIVGLVTKCPCYLAQSLIYIDLS